MSADAPVDSSAGVLVVKTKTKIMAKFKPGQKVVCIETDPRKMRNIGRSSNIINGNVYTVDNPGAMFIYDNLITIKENDCFWIESSFEPLIEDETTDHRAIFISSPDSRKLAEKARDYNPMEVPEHLTQEA